MSHAGGFMVFTVCSSFMLKFGIWLTAQINNVAFSSFSLGDNLFIFCKNATNTPYFLLQLFLHQYINTSVRPTIIWLVCCEFAASATRTRAVSRSPRARLASLSSVLALCRIFTGGTRTRSPGGGEELRECEAGEGDALADVSELQWWTKVSMTETGRLLRG